MHALIFQHLGMVKCILRYLKGMIGHEIIWLVTYTLILWAALIWIRQVMHLIVDLLLNICMFVSGNLVSWKSKKIAYGSSF